MKQSGNNLEDDKAQPHEEATSWEKGGSHRQRRAVENCSLLSSCKQAWSF